MMMSCVGFEVYKFSEPPLLAQQLFQSPPFRCLKILGAPPQYLHPPLVILNELSLKLIIFCGRRSPDPPKTLHVFHLLTPSKSHTMPPKKQNLCLWLLPSLLSPISSLQDRYIFWNGWNDHVKFELIIWKHFQTTETIRTIEGYPRNHHSYSSNWVQIRAINQSINFI